MSMKYYSTVTRKGAALEATSKETGQPIVFTELAVGDGGGQPISPSPEMEGLIQERWRGPINDLYVDPSNPDTWIAVAVIGNEVGGFVLREAGLYSSTGVMYAVGMVAETEKPPFADGSPKVITIRFPVTVSPEATVNLLIDPSKVLATREYVDRRSPALFGLSLSAERDLIFTRFEDGDAPGHADYQSTQLLPAGCAFALNDERELIITYPT